MRRILAKSAPQRQMDEKRQKVMGIKDTGSQDLSYINIKLVLAWRDLHTAQRNSGQLRKSLLEGSTSYTWDIEGTSADKGLRKITTH